ncbi:hypothetical protein O1611_g481 [Lasiodiplodia mahajangana]|uniref:Uncharacterized protein n=1 Tax=Lasiodiplodia mahajangana TaxID=1108764 RepID=A0ACC2K021_9PEZI|nr:hypothetical protein O1611_g481 [Lasiodiplodia mahajangana]
MGDINQNISNGSCWANVNVALGDEYIPCGNVADGNSYACCHYGDNCLSSNACYHMRFGITYLAGCTTKDFSGPACQNKGEFYDQPWVGLVRCDPDQTLWAGCPEEKNVVGSSPPTANCKCSEDTVLFQDKPMLENVASLPQRLGGTISWFPNHKPTTITKTSTQSTTSSRATHPTSISSTSTDHTAESTPSTPTSPNTAPSATGLSTGEKAGIGIGSAFGAILVICLVAIAVVSLRRRAQKKEIPSSQPSVPTIAYDSAQGDPSVPNSSVFSGFKAELPADEPRSASSMALSSIHSTLTPAQSPTHSPASHQYQPYRPGVYGNNRHSNVSQLSSGTHGYSESLVSALSPPIPEEPSKASTERSKAEQPHIIHEVPG